MRQLLELDVSVCSDAAPGDASPDSCGMWFSCPGLVSLSPVLQVLHFLQENCPADVICCFEEQSLKLPVWITDSPDTFSIESAAS